MVAPSTAYWPRLIPSGSPLISRRLDSDAGISAEAVRQDPNLLMMFAEPDKPAWDGVCGALVNDRIYVTSPKCINFEMWMRNDFRYGQDDPTSWPQPYCFASVAETQRLVLEVEVLWTFYTTVRPIFTGIPSSSMPKADVDLVRRFTTDIGVAQQLQRAGVPVWVLCPLEDLVYTRIDKVDGRVHLGTCPLRLPSVYVGPGADEAKYISFDQFTKSHLGIPNVFVWTVGELRTAAALPTKSHAKRNAPAEAVFLPYNHSSRSRKGHLKPEKSNKFLLVTHELLPEMSTPWKGALLTVDADKTRLEVPAPPFAFPRPDLFVTISDSAKRMSTLRTWLRLRPGHLAMQTSSYTPAKLSHQMWRTILTYDWVGKSGVEDRVRGKETNRRELAANFMAGCIDEMSVQEEGCTEVVWQGKSMPDLKEEDVHEILWELSELAFRMEFLSLDKHLRVVDMDSANCPEMIRGGRSRYTEEMLTTVQWKMAVFYCEAFYVAFGRAPILPRKLRHIPDVEGEYPERAVSLSKAPSYYHDVTEWEAPYTPEIQKFEII
ncbi:hypothetical protein ARMSODRAFT_976187 [Armillaria solidipes]|uniref:Uncharacterized protein n=1 Tax=Armillaria solidipes TaxID=1076256 RepID=A0A2H3BFC9_9AGAR|nr:hypothetical protein ARMSODRAFT_976187 [Armillaria solidipes]